jgi:hypothetical protein
MVGQEQLFVPTPGLENKLQFSESIAYRFILPNGNALDGENLDIGDGLQMGGPSDVDKLPINPKTLPSGSSIGYRSEDPEDVKRFCGLAKSHGFQEVWLQTYNPRALSAALESGLTVDLVLKPWKILPGEAGDPDLNVLGQTGAELNEVAEARIDFGTGQTWWFENSFSPAGPDMSAHWRRLVSLASDKKIRSVILLDAIPGGYQGNFINEDWNRIDHRPFFYNGVELPKSVKDLAPDVYNFGFALDVRLKSLRRFGIDPIDLEWPARHSSYVGVPFFESGPSGARGYPACHFNDGDALDVCHEIEKLRFDDAKDGLRQLFQALAVDNHPILFQHQHRDPSSYSKSADYQFGPPSALENVFSQDRDQSEMVTISPALAEDSRGEIRYTLPIKPSKPTCIDFSEVPIHRLGIYFDQFFKVSKH